MTPAGGYSEIVLAHPHLAEARAALRAYRARTGVVSQHIRDQLGAAKVEALHNASERDAGAVWCLETIADAQDHYLRAWQAMREDRFYAAWCALEQVELALHFLARHFDDTANEYAITFLREHIPQWQSVFPYHFFISPGFLKTAIHCKVCDARLTPRHQCEHRLGEIYRGEMCFHVIKETELIEMSIVENPVQKYSVLFSPDWRYDYAVVHYIAAGLRSPWHSWRFTRSERRQLDPTYAAVGRNDRCPCGSGKKFKMCHASAAWSVTPHVEVGFEEGATPGLPAMQFGTPRYGIDDHA